MGVHVDESSPVASGASPLDADGARSSVNYEYPHDQGSQPILRYEDQPAPPGFSKDGRMPKADRVLSGHGLYDPADGTTTVPENATFTIFTPLGTTMDGALGMLVDARRVEGLAYKTYREGEVVANLTLFPNDYPAFNRIWADYGHEWSLRVAKPTLLKDLLHPGRNYYWAACQAYKEPSDGNEEGRGGAAKRLSKSPPAGAQTTGYAIANRVVDAAHAAEYRRGDLQRIHDLARRCARYGRAVGFWVWNNWWVNDAEAGPDRLSWTDSFVDKRGAPIKRLTCGESACFMLQRIHAREFRSDLYAHLAHAAGSMALPDPWSTDASALGRFHVWVEITTPDPDVVLAQIDLWSAGTNAGSIFPSGAPLGSIRSRYSNRYPITTPGDVGPPPTPTLVRTGDQGAGWAAKFPAPPAGLVMP